VNCPRCQSPNPDDSAFCTTCGGRLAPPAAAAAGAPPWDADQQPAGAFQPVGAVPPRGPFQAAGGPGAPSGYNEPGGYSASSGYAPQGGYGTQGGYGAPSQPRPAGAGPAFQLDLRRLTQVDRIVAGASLIAMISIWLPWYSVTWGSDAFESQGSASFSGTSLHGWLWLEFVVALALIGYVVLRAGFAESKISLPIAHAPLLIIGTGLQLLLILIAFADIPYGNVGMGWGWAAFIGLLAALAAAAPVMVPAARSYLESRNAAAGPRG
jgi:hypothetical protein